MRTLGIILGSIALLIVGVIVWWQITYPTFTYRYRITLEVEVDGAIKTGSSVIEVMRRWDPVPGRPISHYSTAASGEAVFVDLGRAGNVFLLLTNEPHKSPEVLGAKLFHFDPTDMIDAAEQRRRADALTAKRATAELPPDQLPMLVTFTDLNDPKSARVVRPGEFEQVFGPDVHFRRAFVEMVPAGTWPFSALGWPRDWAGEPVTRGIEKKLPMLVTHRDSMWRAYSEPMKFTPQYHLFTRS
jgi:hypothetical protein